ncbi:carboxymuconolactone decarboxylase family protein [Staphylococcus gallinarum]|uniref:Carboxymuconolactone decarboxylase family protein n=2 Tax=Staphylococcus gallinarum TaxID=1293 RepID=A0A0D0RPU0_STAGA|nr:alkylhydroperoxidase [Staphylococcus gallinarum]KIR11987.1 alkylhydroperoxidase [Staphylococcus gallinarum]MCD8820296.1 carboxymuconolactone decarboxylase family protein [Staphylococcus gallinarum]MCD8825725.1 carboxymuconolactone decarboxylase family protein [Staphylococcus gallinarum]MCD8843142.1 carboxymuconolactone decarboxylase family protein [Staphylococcus gallinarum]MCD8870470.1 carboxymuconolactone decarboxylase family protein [Staphylococcus gallinarum]
MTIIKESNFGDTPFQKLLGHNLSLLNQWNNLSNTLSGSEQLSQNLKEELRKMLAQNHGCNYCKSKGKPNLQFSDQKSLICIGFTDVYIKSGTNIPKQVIKVLQSTLTDKEISELIAFITFTTCQQHFGAIMQLEA